MAQWTEVQNLTPKDFKRFTGIKRTTFDQLVGILEEEAATHTQGGRPHRFGLHDRLLMALMYWREARTLYHIAVEFGWDESNVRKNILGIEEKLLRNNALHLPGKKELLKLKDGFLLIDAFETTIERPKRPKKETPKK